MILVTSPPRKGTSFLAPCWEPLGPKRENEKVCLDCTGVCGLHIQPSGKKTFPMILGVFFKSALREASGTRFFAILSDFELPGDDHLASKRHQKKRAKKVFENGDAGLAGNRLWVP